MQIYTIVNIINNTIHNIIKNINTIFLYFYGFINILKYIIILLMINIFYYYKSLIILFLKKYKTVLKNWYGYFYVSVSCHFVKG